MGEGAVKLNSQMLTLSEQKFYEYLILLNPDIGEGFALIMHSSIAR